MKADTAYSLEADEVVTINCTYSPRTADLDFGFITPDNTFHFTSGSEGSIKTNIQIEDTGKYYFAVRNNTKIASRYWDMSTIKWKIIPILLITAYLLLGCIGCSSYSSEEKDATDLTGDTLKPPI